MRAAIVWSALYLVGCAARATPSSAPSPSPSVPAEPAKTAPAQPAEPAGAALSASASPQPVLAPAAPPLTFELIAECTTRAIEIMGWLPAGAHEGQFMLTAKQVGGLPAACDVLADEAKPRFKLPGGAEVYAEPSEEPTTKTNGKTARVKLAFACTPDCTERKDVWVTLPSNYCYSWATARRHGEGCAQTLAACQEASKGIVPAHLIPCARHLGALWCGRDARADRCFGSPWACRYEIGDGNKNDLTGGCQKQSP